MNDKEMEINFREGLDELVRRTAKIRELSAPLVKDIDDADAYSVLLNDHFSEIGRLATENREFLEKILYPLLNVGRQLTGEETEALRLLYDHLLNGHQLGDLDCRLLHRVSRRLLADARQAGTKEAIAQQDRHITACYELSHQTKRMKTAQEQMDSYRQEGLAAAKGLLVWLDKDRFADLPDAETKRIVLFESRYYTVLYEKSSRDDKLNTLSITALFHSLNLAKDPYYIEAAPEYDWNYHTIRTLEYIGQETEIGNMRGFDMMQCSTIADQMEELEKLWKSDPETNAKLLPASAVKLLSARNRYYAKRIDGAAYRDILRGIYAERKPRQYDFYSVLENLLVPLELLISYGEEECSPEEISELDTIYRQTISYVFHTPDIGTYELLLEYFAELLYHFREFPGAMSFEEMGLSCMAALHPPTYVHSLMVGRLSGYLCEQLLLKQPELFVGMLDCKDVEAVKEHGAKIRDFCIHAANCHDFGKLPMIDTISVYGRRLMDSEFSLVRHHSVAGATMLASHASTREYADIAGGHHLWVDGDGGYPKEYVITDSPYKTLIRIVTVADSLDAATDSVGRSYNVGKAPEEVFEEIRAESGTRYATEVAALLEDAHIRQSLCEILKNGRRQCYRETWELLKRSTE